MGVVIDAIKHAGETVVHTVTHTVSTTIDGIGHSITVVTNEAGEAVHDVVVAGKVVVKAGQKIV